jgi:hypothetical protein
MVVVEAARRGKQLGEVHGFAAAAVEFVDLGAAAESVGEDHRARRGFPQPGQQGALGAGFAHLAVADLEAEVAGEAAAAGLQVLGPGCCTRRSRGIVGYVLGGPVVAAAG